MGSRGFLFLRWILSLCLLWTAALAAPARAQLVRDSGPRAQPNSTAANRRLLQELQIPGDQQWTDTTIDVKAGERLLFTAKGSLKFSDAKQESGPEGLPRGWKDLLRVLPLNDAGRGALLGRIGDDDGAQPFVIGAKHELQARVSGRLFLGINQLSNEEADGGYQVTLEIFAAAAGAQPAAKTAPASLGAAQIPGIDAGLFAKIPRRVSDKDGNAGDMVNFLILGSEAGLRRVFDAAGWVKVDRTAKEAVLHGLLSSISKQAYTQMPMSELYLFGRFQDFGYAHAEPIRVAASRHHLRLWKAPFTAQGQTLWVGAATHDIGFEKDQRTGRTTHKIDPNVDEERDYVIRTLGETGQVAEVARILPPSPVKQARTASGGSFHSSGEVFVLRLGETGRDATGAFADLFCSVLQKERGDGGEWGPCGDYLETPASRTVELKPIPESYRVLIVPGVLSSCAESAPAFLEGQAHLREEHGLTVDFLRVPNESSESNGRRIANFLRGEMRRDPRKFIVLAYSKGAPDMQEALAFDPEAARGVAAFITVAGAVGGSPIADAMPAIAERYAGMLKLGACEGNLADAFGSLRRDVRQRFLTSHPDPVVPTFSIVALSDESNTSKLLQESWKILSVYDARQDSQLTKFDAIVPGAAYLGAARADHLAVALPFETAKDASVRSAADHNHYPRAALTEALVRFAIQSIESPRD